MYSRIDRLLLVFATCMFCGFAVASIVAWLTPEPPGVGPRAFWGAFSVGGLGALVGILCTEAARARRDLPPVFDLLRAREPDWTDSFITPVEVRGEVFYRTHDELERPLAVYDDIEKARADLRAYEGRLRRYADNQRRQQFNNSLR